MAVSSKRTTRSMAAAARRPSTPAEYKMEDSLTLKAEVDTVRHSPFSPATGRG